MLETFNADNYLDYYVVVESTTPIDSKMQIEKVVENKDGLSFVRFSTCLQSFNGRNKNGRLWTADIVRRMLQAPTVQSLIRRGSFVGENGHPVPAVGEPTLARILTRDPNNISHRILSTEWKSPNMLHGIVETVDEGVGSPGYRFMRNIIQGIDPAFSLRSIVPQRKNPDNSIDVLGPGTLVCYDRVYNPSHEEAYIDIDIPVKNIIVQSQFTTVMESYCSFALEKSEKVNMIIDDMQPALETATIDENGIIGIRTSEGKIFVSPEVKYRRELKDVLGTL